VETSTLFSLRLSLQVALLSTAMVIVAGVGMAYLLARRPFPGRDALDILLTLPLVLPPTVVGYYLIMIFGRNGWIGKPLYEWTGFSFMFTWYAAVLASFVVSLPLMLKTARAAFEAVDSSLVKASYVLGRGEFETLFRVVLPLAKRGILAGAVLAFARAMGEFGATLMLAGNLPGRTDTMPLAIYAFTSNGDWTTAHFMVMILTGISGLLLLLANRQSRSFA